MQGDVELVEELRRQVQELRRELEAASSLARDATCERREAALELLASRAIALLRNARSQIRLALSLPGGEQYFALRELEKALGSQVEDLERELAKILGRA